MTDPAFPTRSPADARSAPGSTGKLERLKALQRELFQLDRGDPDFGPYRIMNPKTAEVAALLDRDLLPQVKTKLNLTSTEEPARLEKEQEETRWKAWELGVDPDLAPRPSSSSCNLPPVALDLYSRLQSAASAGPAGGPREEKEREKAEADAGPDRFSLATHAPFLDAGRIHERLLRRKRQRGWHNLVIERRTVERLLGNDDWCALRLPPERLNPTGFPQLRLLPGLHRAAEGRSPPARPVPRPEGPWPLRRQGAEKGGAAP